MGLYFLDQSAAGLQFLQSNTPLVPLPSISSINGGSAVVDGQQDVSVIYADFGSAITTVNLKATDGAALNFTQSLSFTVGVANEVLVDFPDVSAIVATTAGIPFTSSTFTVSLELGDGTDTAVLSFTYNPHTGYAKTDVVSASTALGSFFYGFTGTVADNDQAYYPTASNTALAADGTITSDLPSGSTIAGLVFDQTTGEWKPHSVQLLSGPWVGGDFAPSIAENATSVGTYSIINRNGEVPTLSGPDAALFTLTLISGDDYALAFAVAPDYETPGDVGTDNVYNVDINIDNLVDTPVTESVVVTVTNVLEETTTAPADTTQYYPEGGTGIAHTDATLLAWLATASGTGGAVTNDLGSKADPLPAGAHVFTFSSPDAADDTATLTVAESLAPVITGTTAYNHPENTAFQADFTITNRLGQTPTLSGNDAPLFTFTPLTGDDFRLAMTAKDFESPGDQNADNIYEVTLNIDDGINAPVSQAVTVTITDVVDVDIVPDQFDLGVDLVGVEPGVTVTRSFVVAGVDVGQVVTFSATGTAQVSGDDVTYGATVDVQNGDTVFVRLTSGTYDAIVTGGATCNGISDSFSLTTRAADIVPDAFSFTDVVSAELSTEYISDAITVTGVDAGQDVPVTILNGEYSVSTDGGNNWGAWTAAQTNVQLNYQVRVRRTSSPNYLTAVTATLDVGGVQDVFSITTKSAVALSPDPFDLDGPITGATLSQLYEAEPFIVSGLPAATSVTISTVGGEYNIDGAGWTSASGTVQNGQTVQFRVAASAQANTVAKGTLTLGAYSTDFYVITGDGVTGTVGLSFRVKDSQTRELITSTTIDIKVLTDQFNGIVLHEEAGVVIDATGLLVLPMDAGTVGQQVWVDGVLASGKYIAGNTLLADLT